MNEQEKTTIRSLTEDLKMVTEQYADAPECGEARQESVIERILQELEKGTDSLSIQVEKLHAQFNLILIDKSSSAGVGENPSEKYPAYSPLAKRLEALNEQHRKISYHLNRLRDESEI